MIKNRHKGFSLVELVVVVSIMAVMVLILAPALLQYNERSRAEKDNKAMDEIVNAVQLALADSETFDEAYAHSVINNYITYTDSSGKFGAKYKDEEFWAPDGAGHAITITFNPDNNGDYHFDTGFVNDMTFGNGSVAEQRVVNDELTQCYFKDMVIRDYIQD